MQGFRSPGGLQQFTSVFSAIRNFFVPLAPTAPLLPPIFTVSTPWRNGKSRQMSLLEAVKATEFASMRPMSVNVTTPPTELTVYPDVHHGFLERDWSTAKDVFGPRFEYNETAAEDSLRRTRDFLERYLMGDALRR